MLARKSKTEPASSTSTERPTLRGVSPDYAAAIDKEQELNEFIAASEAEIQRISRTERVTLDDRKAGIKVIEYGSITDGHINIPGPPRPPEPTTHSEKIVSLLGKLTPPRESREPPKRPFDARIKRCAELSDQIDTAREALRVLMPVLRRLHLEASAELCRALAPYYRPIADRACAALAELASATIENEAFLGDLRREGCAFGVLRPVLTQPHDQPGSAVETVVRLLQYATDSGWYSDEIPEAWRKR